MLRASKIKDPMAGVILGKWSKIRVTAHVGADHLTVVSSDSNMSAGCV